ncbi:hypothetical protein [Halarchaeum nitratireducens]|nr:hypothetical protein [Halarchaeum nitratireducens]
MGSVTAAGAAGIGTGAFTSVSASRSVSLETASDNDAYLAFTTTDAKNSAYVSNASSGAVSFNLDGDATPEGDGSGLNRNATTQINDIVRIQNQGTEPVLVYVPPSSIDNANSTWKGDSENLRIDPQATNRPHGDYEKEATGNLDGGVADDQISLTGGFHSPPYTYSAYGENEDDRKEEFLLDTGEELSFGLYVKTPDSDKDVDISMEIVADATAVTDSLKAELNSEEE